MRRGLPPRRRTKTGKHLKKARKEFDKAIDRQQSG
jgi:hypothetical protein